MAAKKNFYVVTLEVEGEDREKQMAVSTPMNLEQIKKHFDERAKAQTLGYPGVVKIVGIEKVDRRPALPPGTPAVIHEAVDN